MIPRTLAARVAWAAGTSVALGGMSVAVVAGVLEDRFARAREDDHLRDTAGTLAGELVAPGADVPWIAADETRELANTGMTIAIYEGPRFLGGDASLPLVRAGQCSDAGARRVCAVEAGGLVAIAARDGAAIDEQRETFAVASGVAVVLVALLGALGSQMIARISVAPLARLRAAVERVREDDAAGADLGTDEGVAEVDMLRASLASSFAGLATALSHARRFSADAAHELRTPLTAIVGELDLAAESAELDDARESIERARRTAARLTALIDRLLVLARPSTDRGGMEPLDLREVVEDALETMHVASRKRVTFEAPDAASVRGDHALLVAMISNAIENALKHGGGDVVVSIGRAERRVLVTIDDDGPGIPEDEQVRVFAAFYRTRASRAGPIPGHGIGLALIAHVAALHGGTARFEDCARGTRLEIALPG